MARVQTRRHIDRHVPVVVHVVVHVGKDADVLRVGSNLKAFLILIIACNFAVHVVLVSGELLRGAVDVGISSQLLLKKLTANGNTLAAVDMSAHDDRLPVHMEGKHGSRFLQLINPTSRLLGYIAHSVTKQTDHANMLKPIKKTSHSITCVGEELVNRPHLLGEVAQGISLLDFWEVEK